MGQVSRDVCQHVQHSTDRRGQLPESDALTTARAFCMFWFTERLRENKFTVKIDALSVNGAHSPTVWKQQMALQLFTGR